MWRLNRELEFIPNDETLVERRANNKALTRPELSVLNCYVKVQLKESLADDALANDHYMAQFVEKSFPPVMRQHYKKPIYHHILRQEIIATQLANDMVDNYGGLLSISALMESTGEKCGDGCHGLRRCKGRVSI